MKLVAVLKKLSALEQAAAELYEWYSQIFEDVPGAAPLFSELARQELAHRDLVDFQLRIVARNADAFDEVEADLHEVSRVSALVEQHISEGVFQIGDAIDFALSLEGSAAEAHYRKAIGDSNPRIARLVDALGRSDDEHRQKIERFAAEIGHDQGNISQ